MEVPVVKFGGGSAGNMEIPETVSARKFNGALVHQVVCANFANARQGTRAQKTRGEVSHSTRKLFRQKGSGRARPGMSSSPIRRGGGRAFPARPDENFKQKTPRRMFRAAMAMMLSQLLRENRLVIAESLEMQTPKTQELLANLGKMNISGRPVLMVDTEVNSGIELSARNVPHLHCCTLHSLMPSDLAAADTLVFSGRALQAGLERWS